MLNDLSKTTQSRHADVGFCDASLSSLRRQISNAPAWLNHLTSLREVNRDTTVHLMDLAGAIEAAPRASVTHLARGYGLGVLFYQQSTRTRMSFEAAMMRIGGFVTGFADPKITRAVGFYEETLEDVIRFSASVADVLILRHTETGASSRAALVSSIPLINAGDGYGEHPTQALGDIHHLRKHFGHLDGLTIGIIGHLGWRAHRSLVIALSLFDIHLAILEPPGMVTPVDVLELMRARCVKVTYCENIAEVLNLSDAVTTLGVYHANFNSKFDEKNTDTRKQERPTPASHKISAAAVKALRKQIAVLHIGPIADHIDREIDLLPQAHYFQQAKDGFWMRAALLAHFCKEERG